MQPDTATRDPRVYSTLEQLRSLESHARALTFLPRQPAKSVLNGRHASRIRGRGLNFEELRTYLPGDDIRSIDWKVTARTGEPHVRVYSEERDRPALLLVDQRQSMFFGSRLNMKSVTAAETAALAAFRILDVGDRIGGIVFNDSGMTEIKPQRSGRALNALLAAIADKNLALRADAPPPSKPSPLNAPIQAAARIARHDHLIIIISDFDGIDKRTEQLVSTLARHNDVVAVLTEDPVAREPPKDMRLVASDGRLQMTIDTRSGATLAKLQETTGQRLENILSWRQRLGIPVLPISSGEETVIQLRRLMGRLPDRGRRRR